MKKNLLFFCFILIAVIGNSQITRPVRPITPANFQNTERSLKDLSASTITCTNYYVPGTTMNLEFTITISSPDQEYGDSISITFPTGITPTGVATNPIAISTQGQGDEALNGVQGQTITWGDNDNSYGGVEPGSYNFFVEANISSGLSGVLLADFHISGDLYGTPADANGTIILQEAPTCMPSQSISASNIQSTSASISWTGGGASNWNIQYGQSGFILGTGTTITNVSNPYTLGGLQPETVYNVYIQDSCGIGDVSPWSSIFSFQTQSTCPAPTNISISNITETGATINWTTGGASMWNLAFAESGNPLTILNNVSNPYVLSGLNPGTIYEIYIQDSCGVGDVSIWSFQTFQTIVNCPASYSIPFYEGFEYSSGIGFETFCWQEVDADLDSYSWVVNSGGGLPHSGNGCATSASWMTDPLTPENWLISPVIDLTSASGSIVLEYYIAPSQPPWVAEHYKLMASVSGSNVTDFTDYLYEETLEETPERYFQRMVNVSQYIGQTVQFAWVHYNCTDQYLLCLDDVSVHENTNIDLGIAEIISPSNESACDLGTQQNVAVELFNFGGTDLSGFQISYSCPLINGGVPVTETVTQSVPASGSLIYTFSTPASLSGYDSYILTVEISGVTGDQDAANNILQSSFVSSDAQIQIHAFTDNQSGQSWYIKNILTNETIIQGMHWIWNAEVWEEACVFSDQCYETGINDVNGMLDGVAYLEILYNGTQVGGSTTPNSFTGPSLVVPYIGNGCPSDPDLSASGKLNFEYTLVPLSQIQSNNYTFGMDVQNIGATLTSATSANVSIPQAAFSVSAPLTLPLIAGATQEVIFTQNFVPSGVDIYDVFFSVNASGDLNTLNNYDTISFEVTDTVMSREDGIPDSGVGGGPGSQIDFAQKFKISASDYSISSISFMLASSTTGDVVKVEVYNEVNGKPGIKVGESGNYVIGSSVPNQFYTVPLLSNVPVSPGNYYAVIRDISCAGGLYLAYTEKYFTQNTALVMINGGPWSNLEEYTFYCALMLRINIVYDPSLQISVSTTDAGCGQENGTATVSVSGGSAPYTYLWSNGETGSSVSGLAGGVYSVQVEDATGTTNLKYFTINSGDGATIALNNLSNVTCYGGVNGSININVTGGTAPYAYDWSNGAVTQDLSYLSAGTYEVIVTDAMGCLSSALYTVSQPTQISLSAQTSNATCGSANGSATVNATGGVQPYYYYWSNGMTTQTISGLGAGSYKVTVTDFNGCVKYINSGIVVNSIGGPVVSLDSVISTGCGSADGAIYISVQSVFSALFYSWSNGSTDQDLIGVPPGEYTVNAIDSNGCIGTYSREILAIDPPVQNICMVTVDSSTSKNLVMWEKEITTSIDHYNIYREGNQAGNYSLIGSVPYDNMSEFIDSTSNPNVRAYRYKISAVDLCGAESEKSSFHKTMHLTMNQGIALSYNLIWDHYEGVEFWSYLIYRHSDASQWELLDSMPSTLTSYTDYPPVEAQYYYKIGIDLPDACYPSSTDKLVSGPYSSSFSNLDDNVFYTFIDDRLNESKFWIYPNPTNGTFYLGTENVSGKTDVELFNLTGQIVYSENNIGEGSFEKELDISTLANGLYYLRVKNEKFSKTIKVIKN